MEDKRLDLSCDLYVISTDNPAIPALELNRATGTYTVLIFTSQGAARRYCHHRNPDMIGRIKKLPKKVFRGSMHQIGLIKIADSILKYYKHFVKAFVFDHPGTRGPANYASVEDVYKLGRLKKNEVKREKTNELVDFLDNQE